MIFNLRKPVPQDGLAIHDLVELCPPLDANSSYCNLLQASYFSDTAIVAEKDGELLGLVTGFISPKCPETLFVWQVAVSSAARGFGLAGQMLDALAARCAENGVRRLETTITKDNESSWRLFEKFSDSIGAELKSEMLFDKQKHFDGRHASEWLVSISPLARASSEKLLT
jgi:L-2,4-diaminobutyric acid acetyltransferase